MTAERRRRESRGIRLHLALARDERQQCEQNRGKNEHNAVECGSDLTISHDVFLHIEPLDTRWSAMETAILIFVASGAPASGSASARAPAPAISAHAVRD